MKPELKKLATGDLSDFSELLRIFENVFEIDNLEMPADDRLSYLLAKEDFLIFVAKHDDKVVGGMTVHLLDQYYSLMPLAYLYDLGVSPIYQRKGIGRSLIQYLTDYCSKNKIQEAYVDAEATDLQAINFYRSTNISRELSTTQFTYSLPVPNK